MRKLKFEIGQIVYYLNDNKICSGMITTIVIVENIGGEQHLTNEQEKNFLPAGKTRLEYYILKEEFNENELFDSRESLVQFLLNQEKNEYNYDKIYEYDGNNNGNYTIYKLGQQFIELFSSEDCAITLTEILNINQLKIENSL